MFLSTSQYLFALSISGYGVSVESWLLFIDACCERRFQEMRANVENRRMSRHVWLFLSVNVSIQSHRLIGGEIINIFLFIVALLSPLGRVDVANQESRLPSFGTPLLSRFEIPVHIVKKLPFFTWVLHISVGRSAALSSAQVRFAHFIYELAFIFGRRALR